MSESYHNNLDKCQERLGDFGAHPTDLGMSVLLGVGGSKTLWKQLMPLFWLTSLFGGGGGVFTPVHWIKIRPVMQGKGTLPRSHRSGAAQAAQEWVAGAGII